MELNIALIIGFVIWCGISTALVLVSELRIHRLRTVVEITESRRDNYYKLWKKESEKFSSLLAHLKALTIMGGCDDLP